MCSDRCSTSLRSPEFATRVNRSLVTPYDWRFRHAVLVREIERAKGASRELQGSFHGDFDLHELLGRTVITDVGEDELQNVYRKLQKADWKIRFRLGPGGGLVFAHGRRERDLIKLAGQPCVDLGKQLLLGSGGRVPVSQSAFSYCSASATSRSTSPRSRVRRASGRRLPPPRRPGLGAA